ncbi:MAG: PqqD family protein [Croceibacterium sp.]
MQVSSAVVSREVGEETMLLDLGSGTYFGLDPVGAQFWQLLEEGKSGLEARDILASEYDVPVEQLTSDLEALLEMLTTNRLVAPA